MSEIHCRKNSLGKGAPGGASIGCSNELTIPKWLLEKRVRVVEPRLEWGWHSLRNRLLTKQGEVSAWQQASRKWLQTLSLHLDLHVKATLVLTMTINLWTCYNTCVIIFHWDIELIHIYFLNDSGQHVTQAVIMLELAQGCAINGSWTTITRTKLRSN